MKAPNTAEEYYGPTGGGASAVFLNDKLIAVAGGGGGAGTRFYSYTVWNDMQSGPQPKEFLPLILETTEAAQGGSGGAGNGANGSSFSEIYKFFPGPSIRANGGLRERMVRVVLAQQQVVCAIWIPMLHCFCN